MNYPSTDMKPIALTLKLAICSLIFFSCQPASSDKQASHSGEDSKAEIIKINPQDTIPKTRKEVSSKPVAVFEEKTENPLNDWYFRVKIYETPKTFRYVMKMQYEEINGTDTLKLPNQGIWPTVQIRKGEEKYSCIVGFLDKDGQFREYKKVYVKENVLKVKVLKSYVAYTYR